MRFFTSFPSYFKKTMLDQITETKVWGVICEKVMKLLGINVFQKKLMRNFFGWPLSLLSNHIKVAVFTSSFLPKLFSEDFSTSAFFWSFWITHYSRISVEQLTMIRKLISSLKCPQVSFHKTIIIKNFPWLQFLWQLLRSYVCMFLHLAKPLCS